MNNINIKYLAGALTALAVTTAIPRMSANVRDIADSSMDAKTIVPESFETDTYAMRQNWYLRNYAVLDQDADDKPNVAVSDEELIERLGALPTVIEMPYNSIVRSYINLYTERRKQLVENMLGMSLYYMPIFEEALDRHGLPMELKYLPVIESALNPVAVSRAGATGLWQFMLPTATGLGLEVNSLVDQRRDPYKSSEAAAVYLKQLHDMFGDWSLAIAAYNCGPGNINKALRRAGGDKKDFWEIYPFLPAETRGYLPAFIAANYVMNHYAKHNISPALARRPIVTDTVHVGRRVHFEQISDVLSIPIDELRALNPQYRKDVIPGNIKPYSLVLPSMQVYAYLANEDSIVNHNAERFSRRGVVEPADGSVTGRDDNGEYVDELIVKYHKVRKNENLASIAKKYGVTVKSIRSTNKIGKKVKAGQRLKINTYKRRYKPVEPKPALQPADSVSIPTDSIPVDSISVETVADSVATTDANIDYPAIEENVETTVETVEHAEVEVEETPAPETNVAVKNEVSTAVAKSKQQAKAKTEAKKQQQPKKAKTTSHKVKSGENLSKIAKRYGVTVKAIRDANNMNNDNIKAGQRLTIPAK